MKIINFSRSNSFANDFFLNKFWKNLQCKGFSTRMQPKKSFLLNKNVQAGVKEEEKISQVKLTNNKVDHVKLNLAEEKLVIEKEKESSVEKAPIKENYACVYYKFNIEKEFNLFHLRNMLYAYIFVRQRKGHIYLNFADSTFMGDNEEKNKKVEEMMKIFDWLDITLDFNDKFKTKMFESQRANEYTKWLKYLIDQKDAYRCFCKNYRRCENNCCDSRENMENSEDFRSNSEVMYIRFKNQNRTYKYYDYMNYEDKEFDSSDLGDFLLYKNFNKQFLDSYKRVIDDDIYSVTHIIEEKKNFNNLKNSILTKHLLFGEKKYIELPNLKIKYWNQEEYNKIDISYLKSRFLMPEAILNEALMLGYTKNPAKEYKELLLNNRDKDVADWNKVMFEFDITNTYVNSSNFDFRRLLYLNKRNMIKKFIKSHESAKLQVFGEFKQHFLSVYKKYENKISKWDYETWRKIIYLISPNILSYEDLYTFYFLFEPPIVSSLTKENKRTIKAFILDEDYKKHILKEIFTLFSNIQSFDAKNINKEISYFIFKRYQKDRNISNINFYPFLKLIITGYADAPNIGEICEFIGKKEVIERIKIANKITKNSAVDNARLIQDKKTASLQLLASGVQLISAE